MSRPRRVLELLMRTDDVHPPPSFGFETANDLGTVHAEIIHKCV